MESFERALKATLLLLQEDPAGNRHGAMMNPSGNKKPRRALHFVLNVLRAGSQLGDRQELIGDLKDATYETFVCQQNNERALRLIWNLHVVAQQWTGGHPSGGNIGNIHRALTTMDPFTIVSILAGVLSCVAEIFDTIEKTHQLGVVEHEALKALRRTIGDVEDDIKYFKTMISALESTENEHTLLFLQGSAISRCPLIVTILGVSLTFSHRHVVKNAMEKFREDLSALTILLGTEPATEALTLPNANNSLRSFLVTLMRVPPAMQRTVVPDLNEARNKILNNQMNINRDFKLIWHLYTISQQQSSTGNILSMDPGDTKSLDEALDAVSWEFIGRPFGISRPSGSFSFSVLNRDHNATSRQEILARKLGRGWIDDRVNRHHVPASLLINIQITLFELIWSGTVSQLKRNLTRTTNNPEHRDFEVTLDQLDKSLQEVIARSKRPRFTLSFYGMVKAGKSLFLNSLIGSIVLPSNGRYP